MRLSLSSLLAAVLGLIALLGSPERLSLLPPSAQARSATVIVCSSVSYRPSYCRVDTRGGVQVYQQLSHSPCDAGRNWGTDGGGIWVDEGCSAKFIVGETRHDNSGDVVGALIVGGIVGAMLNNSNSGSRHHRDDPDDYYDHPYHDDRWQRENDRQLADMQQKRRDIIEREQNESQRAMYQANQQRQRDQRDREQQQNQRAQYEENQRRQQEAEAEKQAEIKAGEEDELRQAREAEKNGGGPY